MCLIRGHRREYLYVREKKWQKDAENRITNFVFCTNQPTNQPTNSMEQILSWEENNHSDSQGRFITVFTTSRHWSLSWARYTHSTRSHTIYLKSLLILSYHLRPGLPSGLFHPGSPIKSSYAFLISRVLHSCPSHSPWVHRPNYIWWSVDVMKLLIMQSSPASHHFIPLRYKCCSQNIIRMKKPRGMKTAGYVVRTRRWETHTILYPENTKVRDYLGGLGVGQRIKLKLIS